MPDDDVCRSEPDSADLERERIAELIRALVGRDHCKACQLRWASGNRRHCRRCRTSHALAYAIEADAVAEHMLRQGAQNGQNDA